MLGTQSSKEETMANKWADLMDYEKKVNEDGKKQGQEKSSKSDKLKKAKETTEKRFSLIRDRISGLCR